jgi:regulatory protein
LQRALRFLGHRARSEAEVLSYLVRRGYSTPVAKQVLAKLRSLSYVNDEQFARDWARSRFETQGYGPKKIARELETKGVAQTLIQTVLRDTVGQGHEAERARLLLDKRFKNKKFNDAKTLRRAAALLQRRGYSGEVIFDLLKIPTEDIET